MLDTQALRAVWSTCEARGGQISDATTLGIQIQVQILKWLSLSKTHHLHP